MHPDPVTGEMREGIAKVRYSHDAMIDLMVAEPTIQQNQLAIIFSRTPGWVSHVVNSDAFQARLAERKAELVDPLIRASLEERFKAVAAASLEKILERVASPVPASDDFLIQSAKLSSAALGFGARQQGNQVNVAVVVHVPPKSPDAKSWVENHAPGA